MHKVTDNPQMKIRLSQALKTLVEEAAKSNNRTMNAEIISRLEATFGLLNFQVSEKINNLDNNQPFTEAQEARLRELILEMVGK